MSGLGVGIVGCGLIGAKRAAALRPQDELIACYDVDEQAARALSERHGARGCASMEEMLATDPQVVIVAVVHDQLARLAEQEMTLPALARSRLR
jgi:predicted dehydrogenase